MFQMRRDESVHCLFTLQPPCNRQADEREILRVPFRFVKRDGFFQRRQIIRRDKLRLLWDNISCFLFNSARWKGLDAHATDLYRGHPQPWEGL